jgi:branched-chain amino acid transport system substrate-binding protein
MPQHIPTEPNSITRRRALASVLGAGAALSVGHRLCTPALAQGVKPFRIGVINDQSGPYSALGGPGSVVAAKLAVQEFGGKALGRPIEVLVGDHLNKPDTGATIVRDWLDHDVSAVADGGSSAVGVAIQTLTRERNRMFLNSGSTTSELTGKLCSPNAVQWIPDTYSIASGSVQAYMIANPSVKKWFTMVVDYTAGHDMERAASSVVQRNGGQVVGSARFPLGMADFASVLLQAQGAGAQAIALGTAGADAINAIKQFREFGMNNTVALISMFTVIVDVESLGHEAAADLIWLTNFYWDRDEGSRQWSSRFRALRDQTPTRMHASTYGAVLHYLRAVEVVGSDDGALVGAQMRATPASDPLFNGSHIRADGRVLSPLFLMRDKPVSQVRGPNDWAEVIATVPPDQAYRPLSEGGCPLVKS